MKKVLYIDDDKVLLERFESKIRESFPDIEPITCSDPVRALALIDPSLDLLLFDLEMPMMDGKKLMSFARERGVDKRKIIIISSREADYLHDLIPMGDCLCVLNKHEVRQQAVLEMILSSIARK